MTYDDLTVLRKTASGQAAFSSRSPLLTPRLRALMVMIDGARQLGDLCAALGEGVKAQLVELASHGFVEPVRPGGLTRRPEPAPPAAVSRPAPPATAARVVEAPPTRPVEAPPAARHRDSTLPMPLDAASGHPDYEEMGRRAQKLIGMLRPHFGPDAALAAQPVVAAADEKAFDAALDALRERLSIHMGKRMATDFLAPLRFAARSR